MGLLQAQQGCCSGLAPFSVYYEYLNVLVDSNPIYDLGWISFFRVDQNGVQEARFSLSVGKPVIKSVKLLS